MLYRWILLSCAVIGLLMALSFINKGAPTPTIKIDSQLPTPTRNPYPIGIAASGIVEAYGNNIEIGVPYGAIVKECYVQVGDQISVGDPIFLLDNAPLLALVQREEANVRRAKEVEKKVKSQLDRIQSLSDVRAVSTEDVKNKTYDYEIARCDIALAEKSLLKAQEDLEQLMIRSPIDGTVLKQDLRPGNYAQITPKNATTVVGRTDILQVRVDIDEENAWRIHSDQKAIAYTKDITRKEFPLQFMRIEPYVIPKKELTGEPRELIDTRVLQVIYQLIPSSSFTIYPGQQLDIFIEERPSTNAPTSSEPTTSEPTISKPIISEDGL